MPKLFNPLLSSQSADLSSDPSRTLPIYRSQNVWKSRDASIHVLLCRWDTCFTVLCFDRFNIQHIHILSHFDRSSKIIRQNLRNLQQLPWDHPTMRWKCRSFCRAKIHWVDRLAVSRVPKVPKSKGNSTIWHVLFWCFMILYDVWWIF